MRNTLEFSKILQPQPVTNLLKICILRRALWGYEVHITPIDNKLSRVCSVVEITLNVENKEVWVVMLVDLKLFSKKCKY